MVSEQLRGHTPKDVSKKLLGYDIESLDQNGAVRYISVKQLETLGNAFVLSEKEFAFIDQHKENYEIFLIERGNPENNLLIEGVSGMSFEKRVREWEWVSGDYEVKKSTLKAETTAIDAHLMRDFPLDYLNRIQICFLKTLCDGRKICEFERECSCKASSVLMQVNSIADFYLGDTLIEENFTIKGKYLGALKYMLEQSC